MLHRKVFLVNNEKLLTKRQKLYNMVVTKSKLKEFIKFRI